MGPRERYPVGVLGAMHVHAGICVEGLRGDVQDGVHLWQCLDDLRFGDGKDIG